MDAETEALLRRINRELRQAIYFNSWSANFSPTTIIFEIENHLDQYEYGVRVPPTPPPSPS